MRLCAKCWRLSPRESLFCSCCGKSFGGSRCANNHLTPGFKVIEVCPVCRCPELVEPVLGLSLGWFTRFLAWISALLMLRMALHNWQNLLSTALSFASWMIGEQLRGLVYMAFTLAILALLLQWFVGLFSPEAARKLDPVGKALPWLVKHVWSATRTLARLVFLVAEGKSDKGRSKAKDKRGAEA